MGFLRRHLLACTWLWLFAQVASVSALAPRECCDAHHVRSASAAGCHEGTPGAECPMRDADGQPCPMHRKAATAPAAAAAHDHSAHLSQAAPELDSASQAADATDTRCLMRGSCHGPADALTALLWIPGVLTTATAAATDSGVRTAAPAADRLPVTLRSLDTPPPRLLA